MVALIIDDVIYMYLSVKKYCVVKWNNITIVTGIFNIESYALNSHL